MRETLNFSHQRKLFDPRNARHVEIIGVGSVGSNVAVQLAKMGCSDMTLHDGDHVESHNIPSSAYGRRDIGMYKVRALSERIEDLCGFAVRAVPKMYKKAALRPGAVVACVDTMEARMAIWRSVKDRPHIPILVDTRITESFVHVLALDPNDPKDQARYERILYPSSETKQPFCGAHGVAFVSEFTASLAAACVAASFMGKGASRECKMNVDVLAYIGGRIGRQHLDVNWMPLHDAA
jgi:hypothetical protein